MIEPQPEDALLADMKYKLTTRAWGVLNHMIGNDPDLKTIKDLKERSDFDILRWPNCGRVTLFELRLLSGQSGENRESALRAIWVREVMLGGCDAGFDEWKRARG